MSGFWDHYTQANDDIRNTLVDRGWFEGRLGHSNAMQADAQQMAAQQPAPVEEGPKVTTVPQEQHFKEVYGEAPKQQDEQKAVYGESTAQAQSADLYGYDALDVDEPEEDMARRL